MRDLRGLPRLEWSSLDSGKVEEINLPCLLTPGCPPSFLPCNVLQIVGLTTSDALIYKVGWW